MQFLEETKENRKPKIAVLMTTYNRRESTIKCIRSLYEGNPGLDLRFVVADDKSTDNTAFAIKALSYKKHVIDGTGKLFWTGGMRRAIAYALMGAENLDYVLMVNDDVVFFEHSIEELVNRLEDSLAGVIVGATCDKAGKLSYGGVEKKSRFFAKFGLISPSKELVYCDTFNCNCVLIKSDVFKAAGNLDGKYTHSMADYDYGMHLNRMGYKIINSEKFVGECEDNDIEKSWRNPKLSRLQRIKLKEGPKGLPFGDWFYFVRKNYGIVSAIYHSITPYVRIAIGK